MPCPVPPNVAHAGVCACPCCWPPAAAVTTTAAPPRRSCSVAEQQAWLRSYMNDWYFWYALAPEPGAGMRFDTVDAYFDALLYAGGGLIPSGGGAVAGRPLEPQLESPRASTASSATARRWATASRWPGSRSPSRRRSDAPLYVRYVEPLSPAAAAGRAARRPRCCRSTAVARPSVIAADDFSAR